MSGDYPPMRVAAYGLLGVAAVAAVAGLISLAGGSSEATPAPAVTQAAPAPAPAAPAPAPAAPPPAPAVPAPAEPAAPAPAPPTEPAPAGPAPAEPALPGARLPADDTGAGGGKMGSSVAVRAPVRVYNNSMVTGLAERAAHDLRDSGWQVDEVGNYPDGIIPTSTVYYRAGTAEEAAARALANSFGLRSLPRFAGISGASPGLIVIVTQDYQRR